MATRNISGRIQFRRDTAANWTSQNPTLLAGELGYETDTHKGKVGDGSTAWNSLPYVWKSTSITTGSTNGTISVDGTDVAVKGLGSRAYDSTSYLPLNGGALNNNAKITGSNTFIGNKVDNSYTQLDGGTATAKGANLDLFGKDEATRPGYFYLIANNGTTSKRLEGRPDGTLLWNSQNVITSTNLATGNYYTKLQNVFFGNNNQNNYPYHRIATTGIITGGYQTYTLELLVNAGWVSSGTGLVKITVRTNASGSLSSVSAIWVERTNNMPIDTIMIGFRNVSGDTICDIFGKIENAWQSSNVKVLVNGDPRDNTATTRFTLFNSEEVADTTDSDKKASTNSYVSIASANTELYTDKPYTSEVTPTDSTIAGGLNLRWSHNTTDTWIPVRASSNIDYILKSEIISPCLLLSGGTMTGTIVNNSTNFVTRPNDTGELLLFSGTTGGSYPVIALRGKNRSSEAGSCFIRTVDSSNSKTLMMKPDGTFTWNGKNIAWDVKTGSANGTISVNGSDVAVKGLGSAAYSSVMLELDGNGDLMPIA